MSFVDCSKVDVLKTEKKGMGAFSNQEIQKDTLIEKGVMRRIQCEGNKIHIYLHGVRIEMSGHLHPDAQHSTIPVSNQIAK